MIQEEPSTEDILELRECLDNAVVPTKDRMLRFLCPHCGEMIELGELEDTLDAK